MGIDLLNIQPHQVSRDLSGYLIYIYGAAKSGKTSFAAHADKCLILATEKGYSAIPGAMAQDINSWSDIRAVLRELKRPEVKERFKVIAIDTIDIASKYCEKYICAQNSVEDLSEIPYGRAHKAMREEFESVFNSIAMMGYALVFISHSTVRTITPQSGTPYDEIFPSLSPDKVNAIIENMVDIYGYAHQVRNEDGTSSVVLTLRDNSGMIACGSRFPYLADEIPFTYDALTQAVRDAIDEQARRAGDSTVTDEPVRKEPEKYNFPELKERFSSLVKRLQNEYADDFGKKVAPAIVSVTDDILGKGHKVNDLVESQAELLKTVIDEIEAQFK